MAFIKSYRLVYILILVLFTSCANPQATPPPGVAQIVLTATSPVTQAQPSAKPPAAPVATAAPAPTATGVPPTKVPGVQWETLATGLQKLTDLKEAPDGSGRLMLLEQVGLIQVMNKTGAVEPEPYLDIRDRVGSQGSEQGLLGLAFHPQFQQNGFFYVNYTDKNGDTHIARFTAAGSAVFVDPATEKQLLMVKQPFPNHNGGGLFFGPDNNLYIGLGDGGSSGDPRNNAQSLNTLLGKMLRIDVNSGDPYGIPADNPFAKGGGLPEIWAYGLRNPWRFSFDAQTRDLYIADVGQNKWEEIDFVAAGSPPGLNFGWKYREGANSYAGDPPTNLKLVEPVWQYDHGQGCSVTGGGVYRGSLIPELQGTYLYGDYCSGTIWGLKRGADGKWQNQELFQSGAFISSFGQDLSGEFYLLDQKGSQVLRLVKN
jgi:glucose/arabinose dehydrogenase